MTPEEMFIKLAPLAIMLGLLMATLDMKAQLDSGGIGICAGYSNSTTGFAYPKETPEGTLCCESIVTGYQRTDLNRLQLGGNIRSEICGKPYGQSK